MGEIVTSDISQFGYREIAIAAELRGEYAKRPAEFLGDGVSVSFNTHSGCVFLSDEDFNVGVMVGGELVQFFSCPECGNEGVKEDGFTVNTHLCKSCTAQSALEDEEQSHDKS